MMLDSISGWFIIPELGYLKQQAKKKKKKLQCLLTRNRMLFCAYVNGKIVTVIIIFMVIVPGVSH